MIDKYIQRLLGDNEKVIHSSHQHWFILASAVFLEALFILLILIGVTILFVSFKNYPIIAILYILLLFPLISMFKDVLEWQNRQYLVTNRRVFQTTGIFNKSIIDSSLEKVNDVKMVQTFMGRLFDYGDIEILTASELGVNIFKRIQDPILFKTTMMNAKEKLGNEGVPVQYSTSIPVMIEEMETLRRKGIISNEEFQEKKKELLSRL